MRIKRVLSAIVLFTIFAVGVHYAKEDQATTNQEVFALHDNGTAPGYDAISFDEIAKGSDDRTVNFCIPINVAVPKGSRSMLCVKIPKGFQLQEVFFKGRLYSFLKKEEPDVEWKYEAIQVCIASGARISSEIAMNRSKQIMQNTVPGGIKVLEEKTEQYANYARSSLIVSTGIDERSLVVLRYFSGPYDNAQYQYLVGLGDGMTKEKALQKIANFEKECVEVIFG